MGMRQHPRRPPRRHPDRGAAALDRDRRPDHLVARAPSTTPTRWTGSPPLAAYGLGLLSALLLFASILLHELGHSLVARRNGVEIEEIDLWLLGGVARMAGYPKTAGAELRFAIAGPAVTLVIAAVFVRDRAALPGSLPAALRAIVEYQAFVNLAILAFNLLPAFPLDGGRVARALIWGRIGDIERATEIAASIGRGFGYAMIALGLLGARPAPSAASGWRWSASSSIVAARAEESGLRVRVAFTGREAGRLMSCPASRSRPASSRRGGRGVLRPLPLLGVPGHRRRPARRPDRPRRDRDGCRPRRRATHGRRDRNRRPVAGHRRAPGRRRAARAAGLPAGRPGGRAAPGSEVGIVSITDIDQVMRALDLRPQHDHRPSRLIRLRPCHVEPWRGQSSRRGP